MEDTAAQAEAPAEASRPPEPQPAERPALASFADAIAADVNRSDDREADGEHPDPASDVKLKPASPPREDVRPGGRRSAAAAANAQRIADLERQLAERTPEKIRSDLEAEAKLTAASEAERQLAESDRAEAEAYARLRDLEDVQMTDQEYRWREQYKAKLNLVPEATRRARAQAQQEIQAATADLRQRYEGAWDHLKSEMAQAASKPGVERDAIVKGSSFREIADHLYEAGRKSLQPELDTALEKVRRLEAEGRQLRLSGRNGLAAARAPINGGRSAAHRGAPDFRTASSSDLFAAAARQTFDADA